MADPAKVAQQPWCPYCCAPAGPDCPAVSVDHRTAHKADRRRTREKIRKDPDNA